MITALIMTIVGIAFIIPGILIFIFGYKKSEKLQEEYEAMYQKSWRIKPNEDRTAFDKKYAKIKKLNDFYHKWIGFGWGRKLIYSVINVFSQIIAFTGMIILVFIIIALPIDRVAYTEWDEKVDYYNSLPEPTAEDIAKAERLNTYNYGENPFIFLDKDERKHVETYKVNTDEMYRKFYKRVGIIEDSYDND